MALLTIEFTVKERREGGGLDGVEEQQAGQHCKP